MKQFSWGVVRKLQVKILINRKSEVLKVSLQSDFMKFLL